MTRKVGFMFNDEEILHANELDNSDSVDIVVSDSPDQDELSPSDVSASDIFGDVSDSDLSDVSASDMEGSKDVISSAVGYTLADSPDYSDSLNHIDFLLSGILFWLVFVWCAHHIRNAVRSFTGRGIKNE